MGRPWRSGKTVKVYAIYATGGTSFEETSSRALVGAFSPAADTSSHRQVILRNVPLLPFKFQLVVENVDTAQTITVTVNAYTHNDRIVD
jgi:hypothetical protein